MSYDISGSFCSLFQISFGSVPSIFMPCCICLTHPSRILHILISIKSFRFYQVRFSNVPMDSSPFSAPSIEIVCCSPQLAFVSIQMLFKAFFPVNAFSFIFWLSFVMVISYHSFSDFSSIILIFLQYCYFSYIFSVIVYNLF